MKKYLTGKTLTGMWKGSAAAGKEPPKENEVNPGLSASHKPFDEPKQAQVVEETKQEKVE